MRFEKTTIAGLLTVAFEPHADGRGTFTRTYDREAFREAGCETDFTVHAVATNKRRGTVRGMHYQVRPYSESKVVRCTRGMIWDVIVDMRRSSNTFGIWQAFMLDHAVPSALYVPEGLAHGYATLTDDADVSYLLSSTYSPEHAAGCRWDDPTLAISWPVTDPQVSERDRALPSLYEAPDPFASIE